MPNPQNCTVTLRVEGAERKVYVTAASLYEAACLALRAFRGDPLMPEAESRGYLEVEVTPVTVRHHIRVDDVLAYVRSVGKPHEQATRQRLRQIIEG